MRDTHLRPYQVIDLGPDGKIRLIDLWTGATVWLREAPHGPRLVRWDLLAARVVRAAEGDLVIDGPPYRYPVRTRDALLRALRRAHARMGGPVRAPEVVRFFKNVAMIFHHFSLAAVALGAVPLPGAAFVPPLVSSRALFDVRDRTAIVRELARYPDLEHAGDGTWTWLMDPLLLGRALGRVVLEDERLVLETWVEGALERPRGPRPAGGRRGQVPRGGARRRPAFPGGWRVFPAGAIGSIAARCCDPPCHTKARDSRERRACVRNASSAGERRCPSSGTTSRWR